ncbi:YdcF family protein [Caloramator sp. E03]|uniref:YdcF family protein n=1 Tax=Caloramator sp. E03 TaxID=2576307 RepID=UPI001110CA8C|nr:YdcF family protein [Caloramator sp. E03]QCX33284.1 YdcF family protein [Caloramator sp. E03]
MNIFKKIFNWGIILILSIYFVLLSMVASFGYFIKPAKSDCIIVLGCMVYGQEPSPFLKERLNEAIRLYNLGYADYIIVSGGKGKGEDISEALAMEKYLIKKGVKKEKIIKEELSKNTYENLNNSKKIMDKMNLKTAVVVSNKFHLLRAKIVTKKLNINSTYSGIFVKRYIYHEVYGFLREPFGLVKYYFHYAF